MSSLGLRIRRGETPFYRTLRDVAKAVRASTLPLPRAVHPLLRFGFTAQQSLLGAMRFGFSYLFREPLFRGRCASVGKRFRMVRMPFVIGHAAIHIGDDVNFFGKVDIFSGRLFDEPRLTIKDRVDVGHNVVIVVNREIVIEEDVNIASGVRIMDTDAHPRDAAERIADLPPRPEEVKPVRIGRHAWLGQNSFILKGVTVGEGAVVGVNSVVMTDVPPYCVALGNPAKVIFKGLSKPASQQETA
jgi:acetyltransferase-like isoleucine patch superfamily enzyme